MRENQSEIRQSIHRCRKSGNQNRATPNENIDVDQEEKFPILHVKQLNITYQIEK